LDKYPKKICSNEIYPISLSSVSCNIFVEQCITTYKKQRSCGI